MRISKILVTACITLLILFSSVMLLCNWSATGLKTLDVPTGSMTPAIPRNSLVLVKKVSATSLKVGDVITYTNPFNVKQTISHRIVKTYTIAGKIPAFVTKGDANKVADVPITEGSVVGKVVGHVPHAGAWLLWSKGWIGLAVLVYLPALLLMTDEVKRLGEYYGRFKVYRLRPAQKVVNWRARRLGMASAGGLAVLLLGLSFGPTALALLQSNPVSLTNNTLSVAPTVTPPTSCSNTHTTNNNSVTVTNTSNQTASSGNASNSNNTSNTTTTTTGNASNSNNTSTSITITNQC